MSKLRPIFTNQDYNNFLKSLPKDTSDYASIPVKMISDVGSNIFNTNIDISK